MGAFFFGGEGMVIETWTGGWVSVETGERFETD
jgi:hypothetical protein